MHPDLSGFQHIWIVMCPEARAVQGHRPGGLTAWAALGSGSSLQCWHAEVRALSRPPYQTGPRTLIVTVEAGSLAGLHLMLGWPLPARAIDLLVEDRVANNGTLLTMGPSLAGALSRQGLSTLALRGRATSPDAITSRLTAIRELFTAMLPSIDIGRAQLRGRYIMAVARMEARGVPVDAMTIERLRSDWPQTRARAAAIVDRGFGVLDGGRLNVNLLRDWTSQRGIAWPRGPSGGLRCDDETFSDMARAHPEIRPLKEVRALLGDFDPRDLIIDQDGRNRVTLRPFSTRTGRNAPSAKTSVMTQAAWVRNLVSPGTEMGLALIDWSQQEFGIAAALSGDVAMQSAYAAGDPYMAFAVMAGAAPADASAVTHPDARSRFKLCALGLQYGMGAATLARLIGRSDIEARDLQRRHRATFPAFWRWSEAVEAHAYLTGQLTSVFGWRLSVGADANPRMLRNFPLQANGAEMLRLACCFATEAGIRVCMPLHDALLIEAPLADLDAAVRATQEHMAEASRTVLDGFELRTEVKTVRYPQRYSDPRGEAVWRAVERVLAEQRRQGFGKDPPAHGRDASCAPAHSRPISLYVSKRDRGDGTF